MLKNDFDIDLYKELSEEFSFPTHKHSFLKTLSEFITNDFKNKKYYNPKDCVDGSKNNKWFDANIPNVFFNLDKWRVDLRYTANNLRKRQVE
jgi:hypothetical protein